MTDGEVIDFEQYLKRKSENEPHEISELICLKCLDRWIGVTAVGVPLKDMTCVCGERGYIIKTGQTIVESEEPDGT